MESLHYMKLVSKSDPFNAGQLVEMKFVHEGPYPGETYMRVPVVEASSWQVGDEYTMRLRRV
jgi:hypothetical protein